MELTKVQGINGILRIVTLVLGILVLGFTSGGLYQVFVEICFLSMTVVVFIVSVVLLILFLLEILQLNQYTQMIDAAYHCLGGFLLLVTSLLMIGLVFSTGNLCAHYNRRDDKDCPYKSFIVRLFGAFLGLINSFVYLTLALFLYKVKEF